MKFLKEFREFAMRGNVMDMAIGIIIGGAFGKIISSLVADILMPPLGLLLGGIDFSALSFILKDAIIDESGAIINPAITMNYGLFIQYIVDFICIAFSVFMLIRVMNKMKRKKEEAPAAPAAPSTQEVLLTEIRDLLKKK